MRRGLIDRAATGGLWAAGWRCVASVAFAASLGACTTPGVQAPTAEPEALWLGHKAAVEATSSWQASGRVAFRSQREGWSAGFRWIEHGGRFEIRLVATLGLRRMTIQGDLEEVTLRTSEGKTIRSRDAEALLREQLGAAIPVQALRYWLLGVPGPDSGYAYRLDAWGRLERLFQDGWEIGYSEYRPVDGLDLPGRIEASRGERRVKVIVREWVLPGPGTAFLQ